MGNSFGGRRSAKVMKINGETIKFKTPVQAGDITKDYPGHVLLESESVKHYGIRAKPLEPWQELKSKRLYFIVELPKVQEARPRRARSGINMSAKDRLESLMLARRSVSDLTILRPASLSEVDGGDAGGQAAGEGAGAQGASVRVKMRLSKAEVEKLMRESKDEAEVAEKIVGLCMGRGAGTGAGGDGEMAVQRQRNVQWGAGDKGGLKPRQKRVGFSPIIEGEIQVAVAS
ncbi:uncharacterized protein At1g66480 [Impatiens glandulifera]|uniref:uncharacterized protein At1g66480 n=1 Tax=Impatiens glandulifera TaxID=253017 RepID=UPI001FB0AB48|nr:uncharacterized protein At1g66480 [Impatiens glandulifera]